MVEKMNCDDLRKYTEEIMPKKNTCSILDNINEGNTERVWCCSGKTLQVAGLQPDDAILVGNPAPPWGVFK
jgi:hypothetical protein